MAKQKKQGHPARAAAPVAPTLAGSTLKLTRGSMEAVKQAEDEITAQLRNGTDTATAVEVHLALRSASLGLLVAHNLLTGKPDPRSA